nr:IclR family transcriptional regulator [Planobispora longispora]
MTRNSDRLSMLEKSWLVLDAFRPTGGPLRLTDVAERCHLPKTTTFRLLTELAEIGAVARRENGYYLGRRLFELGCIVPLERDLRHAALPFMHDLYEATHETVHLGVRDGLDVVYVEKIRGQEAFALLPGRRPPPADLHRHRQGPAGLLGPRADRGGPRPPAAPPDPALDRRSPAPGGGHRPDPGGRLAYEREEAQPGGACIAAPVFHEGAAVAALSVSVPLPRFHPTRLAPAVKAAALGISRALSRTI